MKTLLVLAAIVLGIYFFRIELGLTRLPLVSKIPSADDVWNAVKPRDLSKAVGEYNSSRPQERVQAQPLTLDEVLKTNDPAAVQKWLTSHQTTESKSDVERVQDYLKSLGKQLGQ